MQQAIFYQLSIVMVIAAVVSLVLRLFRQPLIIGYILTGILVGPSLLGVINDHKAFESFSQIGIALLLFIVGLGLNIGIVKDTGRAVFVAFGVRLFGVGSLVLLASLLLGYTPQEALILAVALLFSSTIIVVKALSDKKEQARLYGQISIGVLLIEDIAATLALLFISSNSAQASTTNGLIMLTAKGVLLAAGLAVTGGLVLPRLSRVFAISQELLYVFALAWAFGIASLFWWAGFSIEVGALFAGVAMAHLPYVPAIASRLKPLRDFFLVLFFIRLGESLGLAKISGALLPALIFSALILLAKPFLTMLALGLLGYTKQTSFKTSLHLSQISEFSIILIVLAVQKGLGRPDLVAVSTLTALITIAVSTYLIKYDDRLFRRFESWLSVFERTETKRDVRALGHYPFVLVGYSEGGYSFVKTFRKMKKDYIVIDYDPDVIEALERRHINHLYGDVTDIELLEELGIHKSEIIVSTLTDDDTNLILARHINRINPGAVFICRATTFDKAEGLYAAGATYVLLPHFIGDSHINHFLQKHGANKRAYSIYRKKHLAQLGNLALK